MSSFQKVFNKTQITSAEGQAVWMSASWSQKESTFCGSPVVWTSGQPEIKSRQEACSDTDPLQETHVPCTRDSRGYRWQLEGCVPPPQKMTDHTRHLLAHSSHLHQINPLAAALLSNTIFLDKTTESLLKGTAKASQSSSAEENAEHCPVRASVMTDPRINTTS